jgi:hypothetical protein
MKTFASIFLQAAPQVVQGSPPGLLIKQPGIAEGIFQNDALAICGTPPADLQITRRGITFMSIVVNDEGKIIENKPIEITWEALSFVLPGDDTIPIADLRAYNDISTNVYAATNGISSFVIYGGAAIIALRFVGEQMAAVDKLGSSGFLGMIFAVILAIILFFVFIIGGSIGAGIAVFTKNMVSSIIKPLVRSFLFSGENKQHKNALAIMGSTWAKEPEGLQTTEVIDLIKLGVKLHRAGLT